MAEREFGFGLIGCGLISDTHLKAIRQVEGARVVAVADAVEAVAQATAEQYGCDWHGDYREMIARDDIDIVNITAPSGLHAPIGIDCARAGKHVICTKPIDVTLEKIDALISACRQHGVKLAATHQCRATECYVTIERAIDEGRLGRILYARASLPWYRRPEYYEGWHGTWELDGGGALMNQSVHYVDLLVWLLGDPVSVAGKVDCLAHDNMETEDFAAATVQFRSGAYATVLGTTCTYGGKPGRLSVHGTKGNVAAEADRLVEWDVEGEPPIAAERERATGAADPGAGLEFAVAAHVVQISDVIEAVRQDREPILNGPEARRAVELILAVYESSRTGRHVTLPLKAN